MSRDCTDKPIFVNQDFEDATYLTYYRACQQDLCNGGSGKGATGGGIILDIGREGTLLVEGVGSTGITLTLDTFLCLILLMILNILILNWPYKIDILMIFLFSFFLRLRKKYLVNTHFWHNSAIVSYLGTTDYLRFLSDCCHSWWNSKITGIVENLPCNFLKWKNYTHH